MVTTFCKSWVGFVSGKRDESGAKALWESLPRVYRQCAVCYTDFWRAYRAVLPAKRHRAVGKDTGLTNHIERFNNPSTLTHHIGAILYFINHYNKSLLL